MRVVRDKYQPKRNADIAVRVERILAHAHRFYRLRKGYAVPWW